MKAKLDIVCIGLPTWEGPYMKSTVQLMKGLARHHRVLYVEYPFTVKDIGRGLLGTETVPVSRVVGIKPRLRRPVAELDSLWVLTLPPSIPANGLAPGIAFDVALQANSGIAERCIRKQMDQLGIRHPVVINALNPTLGHALLGKLDESATIYYCYDEIRGQAWNSRHGADYEDRFVAAVDMVVTTSRTLFETKSKINPSCKLVYNGVDFDLFSSIPRSIQTAPGRPNVVGYVGSLDDRLDYVFLDSVISRAPDLSFVFVGHKTCEAAELLSRHRNVVLTGPTASYNELPSVMADMDVGIIPFLSNQFTASIYPMKINEYLAAGLPVVRTDFANLPEFEGLAAVASTPDAFLAKIRDAIENDAQEEIKSRIAVARLNSWNGRVEQFEDCILSVVDVPSCKEAA